MLVVPWSIASTACFIRSLSSVRSTIVKSEVTCGFHPGAHGAGMAGNGKVFYTTNLPGGGMGGLVSIDTKTNEVLGLPVDTPFPVPHNIALTTRGDKIYVTHSGATADKVSIYTASKKEPVPVLLGEITVELNPFGLTFVP